MTTAAVPFDESLPVLDRESALERLGGDEEMFEEFLGLLLDQCSNDVPRIAQAIQADDAAEVESLAHSLKGAAASLSAERVRAVSSYLEQAGRNGDLSEAPIGLQALNQTVQELRVSVGT